jgi:Flp pilus assembly pilin Flp
MVAKATRVEHSSMARLFPFRSFRRETGQTMAEYSVVLAVITPAIIAVLVMYHDTLVATFQSVVDVMSS